VRQILQLRGALGSPGDRQIRQHSFQRVTYRRYLFHVFPGYGILQTLQVPREVVLEDSEKIEQEFAVVIDAREQFRKINAGSSDMSRALSMVSPLLSACCAMTTQFPEMQNFAPYRPRDVSAPRLPV